MIFKAEKMCEKKENRSSKGRRQKNIKNNLCELLDSQRKIWEKNPLNSMVLCGMLEETGVTGAIG